MTEKQAEILQQVATDMATVKQAIMGNGVKGLSDRMNEVEEWRHTHPRVCPMPGHLEETVPTQNARKVNGWNVFFGIIGAVGVIGSLAVAVLK